MTITTLSLIPWIVAGAAGVAAWVAARRLARARASVAPAYVKKPRRRARDV
ncbi:MAG TPA: hypothetical protein VKT52_08490 [Ktedonobacterales bacterium]|nr:hypothetical protein [Ktedonobacterales bacterium]